MKEIRKMSTWLDSYSIISHRNEEVCCIFGICFQSLDNQDPLIITNARVKQLNSYGKFVRGSTLSKKKQKKKTHIHSLNILASSI